MKQKNILFTGIGCIALSILLQFLLFSEEELRMKSSIDESFFSMRIVHLIAYLLIVPILEELVFRSWIFISQKLFFLPGLSVVFFVYFTSNSYVALLVLALYLVSLLLYIKWRSSESHKKKLLFAFALISSSVFSILHLIAYDNPFAITTKFFYYFGGGMILSFVGLNFHYIFMFLIHIGFNFIISLILLFGGNFENQQQTNESFSIEIKSVPFYTPEKKFVSKDSIHIVGRKAQIAASMHPYLRIKSKDNELKLYEVNIRKTDSNYIDNDILHTYINLMQLNFDSIETNCYEMHFDTLTECTNSNCYLTTPQLLCNLIFNKFNLCVNTKSSEKAFQLDMKLLKIKDFEAFTRFLQENHGIHILESQQKGLNYTVY